VKSRIIVDTVLVLSLLRGAGGDKLRQIKCALEARRQQLSFWQHCGLIFRVHLEVHDDKVLPFKFMFLFGTKKDEQ